MEILLPPEDVAGDHCGGPTLFRRCPHHGRCRSRAGRLGGAHRTRYSLLAAALIGPGIFLSRNDAYELNAEFPLRGTTSFGTHRLDYWRAVLRVAGQRERWTLMVDSIRKPEQRRPALRSQGDLRALLWAIPSLPTFQPDDDERFGLTDGPLVVRLRLSACLRSVGRPGRWHAPSAGLYPGGGADPRRGGVL